MPQFPAGYTAAASVVDADQLIGDSGGTTKKFPASIIKSYAQSGLPRGTFGVNILDYGGVADGATSNSTALTNAIAALDVNRGGTVRFPQGRYYFATGVTTNLQGLVIEGEGNPGSSNTLGRGSTQLIAADGITWLTINSSAASFQTRGPVFRNFHLYANTGATTGNGILAKYVQAGIVENVTCSDFIGGYGLKIDGTAGANAQYWQVTNYNGTRNLTGLHLKNAANGCRVIGGYFEGGIEGAATTPRIGSKGIYVESGDTPRFIGVVIQGYETGIHIVSPAADHQMIGCRTEFCNIGVRIASRNVQMYGCSFANSILIKGSAGAGYSQDSIAVQLDSGAANCLLIPSDIQSVSSELVDNSAVATNEWIWNLNAQPRRKYSGISAAPTTGAHVVGEVVYNSAPAASGTMGWVCTTAGTPGTWKTWGAISA